MSVILPPVDSFTTLWYLHPVIVPDLCDPFTPTHLHAPVILTPYYTSISTHIWQLYPAHISIPLQTLNVPTLSHLCDPTNSLPYLNNIVIFTTSLTLYIPHTSPILQFLSDQDTITLLSSSHHTIPHHTIPSNQSGRKSRFLCHS